MTVPLILVCSMLAAFAAPVPVAAQERSPAQREGSEGVLIPLKGQLSKTMPMTMKRAIQRATTLGVKTLIVEIDTPGGEMLLMEQLRDMLFAAHQEEGLQTAAYINTSADSAGALIAMACKKIYMSPLGHMGSATPVTINPLAPLIDFLPTQTGQEDMVRKIKSSVKAKFRTTAIEFGRNSDIAEAMVDPDIELVLAYVEGREEVMNRERFLENRSRLGDQAVEEISVVSPKGELLNMTSREALDWGFIDGIPETRESLLKDFLEIDPDRVITVEPSWSESMVNQIESINFILLIAGLILIFVEFQIPGFGIPGILGICCLALLFFSQWLAGLAEITEILMIVLGIGLLVVEIFLMPGTFIAGIAGGILIISGLILSFQPFTWPTEPWETDLLQENIAYLSGSVILVLVSAYLISRFLPRAPVFRRFVLSPSRSPAELHASGGAIDDVRPDITVQAGDTGVVHTMLRPAGKVVIAGSVLDAQSEGEYIETGETVKVVRITGNFIFVRPCKEKST